MSRLKILDIQPGYLNDFNVDDVDQESIDFQSETPQSIIVRMKDRVFTPNKFKTSGTLIGILLRVDNECTPQDSAIALNSNTGASAKYSLNTYKVCVPELHFMLPKPENLPEKTRFDKLAIDAYPTIQAIDTLVQRYGAVPGDLVKVELANKGAITRMYFAGPIDPKNIKANAQELKDCIDACKKSYTGEGAPGDCINKNKKASKLDDVIPLTTEAGHQENKLINGAPGAEAPKWLAELVDPKSNDNFKGIVYIGKLEGNGTKDGLEMIEGEGRSVLIYMPAGVSPNTGLEVIYFFHDQGKFAKDPKEWEKIGKTITGMTKKNALFDGARRNLVFVMPEMMWSKENMTKANGYPRASSAQNTKLTTYGDRQWPVWNFNGESNIFKRQTMSYKEKSPVAGVAGDIEKLVEAVNKVLSEKFSIQKKKIQQTTLVADRYGAIAISNLARIKKGLDQFKNLKKIQLWNADYSSTEANHWHDNDIKDIMIAIDPNKVEVEYHLSDKAPDLPKNAVAAYIGRTSSFTIEWLGMTLNSPKDPLNQATDELKEFYMNALAYKTAGGFKEAKNEQAHLKLEGEYNNGKNFIDLNKTKTLRLSGRWVNFIFRGVSAPLSFDWITWWEEASAPTAVSATEVIKTPGIVVMSEGDSADISTTGGNNDREFFSEFKGKTLLYNSQETKAQKGKTAIIAPQGVDLTRPYELIYFLHGGQGASPGETLWRGVGFRKTIQESLHEMVEQKRNIVYVTTQLNIYSGITAEKATFGSDSGATFADFHKEVVDKIKNIDLKKGLGATKDPKFINIKSFSEGGYSLAGLVEKLSGNTVGGIKLKRIDYLNSSYSFAINPVFKKIFVDKPGDFKPGEDLEIHIYTPKETEQGTVVEPNIKRFISKIPCDPKGLEGGKKFNGCAEVPIDKQPTTGPDDAPDGLSKLKGLYLDLNTGGNQSGLLEKRFGTPSLLKSGKVEGIPIKAPVIEVKPREVPVSFDDEGNAYNYEGKPLPDKYKLKDPSVKCAKGKKARQRANTVKARQLKACEKDCRARFTGKKKRSKGSVPGGKVECGPNPLGLINISAFVKGKKYTAQRAGYRWGNKKVGEFIDKVLENPIWGKTGPPAKGGAYATIVKGSQKGKSGIQWMIEDISPKWANGIDMVKGHNSHREGNDFDLSLPIWYEHSRKNQVLTGPGASPRRLKQRFESPKAAKKYKWGNVVDYDKTIVLGLLTLKYFPGSMILFGEPNKKRRGKPGSSFKKWLMRRIKEIQTGNYARGTYPKWMGTPNGAFKDIFRPLRDEGEGGPIGEKLKRMFVLAKYHENHYHVRLNRSWASHKPGFVWAQKRLKKNGCEYTGPHKRSRRAWKAWVKQGGAGTVYLKTTKPGVVKKDDTGPE